MIWFCYFDYCNELQKPGSLYLVGLRVLDQKSEVTVDQMQL